jgi:CRAL/TRIO domain
MMFQLQPKSDAQLQEQLVNELGPEMMRFGAVTRESFTSFKALSNRLHLSADDKASFALIQSRWEAMSTKTNADRKKLSKVQILRIACFCDFHVEKTLKLLRKTKPRHFDLRASQLQEQLETQTIFPCPGLESRDGSRVFMMRPSRYFPQNTPIDDIIDNLIFVMDRMIQQDMLDPPTKGIAFVANMGGWTLRNFSTEYCRKFMMALQGQIFPAEVSLFLILNPPSWFGKVSKVLHQ